MLATRQMYDRIEECNLPAFRILITLHDQLLFNCHKDYMDEAEVIIRAGMETMLRSDAKHRYDMPLLVDIHRQRYWGQNEYTD